MSILDELAARRRFGMKPGLDAIAAVSEALGSPHLRLGRVVHVAGTNGKGATCAILDSCLRAAGFTSSRYTSPHLVALNERFLVNGRLADDAALDSAAARVAAVAPADLTFFEALTACGFLIFSEAKTDWTILETGLGGRLDATNICRPALSVITRIGLDHCDWLGDTIEKIAAEKGGIVKPGAPVVLGRNETAVRRVIEDIAKSRGAPFFYAPDLASEDEIPAGFSLSGSFNRENAVTALAALKVLFSLHASLFNTESQRNRDSHRANRKIKALCTSAPLCLCVEKVCLESIEESKNRKSENPPSSHFPLPSSILTGFSSVEWPGRFHKIGRFIVDGAHNPPAAKALAAALAEDSPGERFALVAGFCGDKDVRATLAILAPFVDRAYAVRSANPRSLAPDALAAIMREAGLDASPCASLAKAFDQTGDERTLVCGSLFLAGEAVAALGAYPWPRHAPSLSESVLKAL